MVSIKLERFADDSVKIKWNSSGYQIDILCIIINLGINFEDLLKFSDAIS